MQGFKLRASNFQKVWAMRVLELGGSGSSSKSLDVEILGHTAIIHASVRPGFPYHSEVPSGRPASALQPWSHAQWQTRASALGFRCLRAA